MSQDKPIFLLIDGHAVIYRAFFSMPPTLTNKEGIPINAVFGFTRILLTAIRDFSPKYIAVTFDHRDPTFRHTAFKDYKANRAEMPAELQPQIELVKQVVSALNIPQFELAGYEADDLIGTISRVLDEPKAKSKVLTIIVTGDRDTFQLVDDNTHVWLPARGKDFAPTEYDAEGVVKKMGVPPHQIIELKALMGDASDNIPGVKGIGPKSAIKLIEQFGTVAALYEALEKDSPEINAIPAGVVTKLRASKAEAEISLSLATIDRNVPLQFDLASCEVCQYDKSKALELFTAWDFQSLIKLLPADEFEASVQAALF
jgi:DNA polymerase-1